MHEVLTIAKMREADARATAAGTPGYTLMLRAGQAVAEAALRFVSPGDRVLIGCGPGNNGGDGFVAARLLQERGIVVEVATLTPVSDLSGDAATAAADWAGRVRTLAEAEPAASALVIDALFGAGLARPLDGMAAVLVERINASGRPVLAVDVPSGIEGDTGRVLGRAVQATETVTFVRRKPGHLLLPGRIHCGRVIVADIGIANDIVASLAPIISANEPPLWRALFPVPTEDGHKYSRGHTLVCSGGRARTGAARLAARAALRVGSGLVTVASPSAALDENAAQLTAIMLRTCKGADDLRNLLLDSRYNVVVAGPGLGLGKATTEMVLAAAEAGPALVLDADALTSFEGRVGEFAARLRAVGPERTVVTPHEGEFARLFASCADILDAPSKLERTRLAAEALGAVMVLKGADTVVAAPDGRAAINANTTPYLATAGSGDVLAGIIAGLLAQGMPAFEAACAGVWLHGQAGREIGPGLIAEDLPEELPGVLRSLVNDIPRAQLGFVRG